MIRDKSSQRDQSPLLLVNMEFIHYLIYQNREHSFISQQLSPPTHMLILITHQHVSSKFSSEKSQLMQVIPEPTSHHNPPSSTLHFHYILKSFCQVKEILRLYLIIFCSPLFSVFPSSGTPLRCILSLYLLFILSYFTSLQYTLPHAGIFFKSIFKFTIFFCTCHLF